MLLGELIEELKLNVDSDHETWLQQFAEDWNRDSPPATDLQYPSAEGQAERTDEEGHLDQTLREVPARHIGKGTVFRQFAGRPQLRTTRPR